MPILHRSDAVEVTGSVDFTTEGTHNVGTCLFFSPVLGPKCRYAD